MRVIIPGTFSVASVDFTEAKYGKQQVLVWVSNKSNRQGPHGVGLLVLNLIALTGKRCGTGHFLANLH